MRVVSLLISLLLFSAAHHVRTSFAAPVERGMQTSAVQPIDGDAQKRRVIYAATYPSFEAAISAAGSTQSDLVISHVLTARSTLTVPANIRVRFQEGGLLAIQRGTVVTINGPLEAGLFPIFSGLGLVNFTERPVREVYPQWWGAKADGVTNDTRAVQQSINAIARAKGGTVLFVKGVYLVDTIVLDSYVNIVGQGRTSIIKHNKFGYTYCFSINPNNEGTPDPAGNKHDITISNIQFRGTVDVDGFFDGVHLLNINAATNVIISKCYFTGWRGDAIYLGSSNVANTERHNKRIIITECVFDGINNDNRNAISIIDGEGVVIDKCSFVNCTRKNMPGAIDLEPDIENFFGIIRDITISNNSFKNVGGFGGVIGLVLLLGQTEYSKTPGNIVIDNNLIDQTGSATGADGIFLYQVQHVTDTTPPNRVIISNNTVRSTRRPFKVSGVKGILFKNNTFEYSTHAGLVSGADTISTESKEKCQQVEFSNNLFKELGAIDGFGVVVHNDVDRLAFIDNTFENIGLPSGKRGEAISFVAGTTDWVHIENNRFAGARTTIAVMIDPLRTKTTPSHNKVLRNTFMNEQKVFLPSH